MNKRFWQKIVTLFVAFCMIFTTTGTLSVSAATETGSLGDGYGYLYFTADNLDVEAPGNCKVAYQINDCAPVYLTSNFAANWVRINKSDLKTNDVNKITLYTGNASGLLDETLSRADAGTDCNDYQLSTKYLALVLPNGKVLDKEESRSGKVGIIGITGYYPKDTTTPLNTEHRTEAITKVAVVIGDDTLARPYKVEIEFDCTDWDGSDDPTPVDLPILKNVSLQIGATPSDRRFVWYSTSTNPGYLQITEKTNLVDGAMPASPTEVEAVSSLSGDTDYYSFQTEISDLEENTEYAYRVGNNDAWSPVYTFKTDDFEMPYSFIAGGDIQMGQLQDLPTVQDEIDGWKNSFSKITQLDPDASFFISFGDQVSDAHIQSQYDMFFSPEQLPSFPLAVVCGNHDPNATWIKHYNMPNTSEYGLSADGACDYSFVYGDTLFMHVQSNSSALQEHSAFIEESILNHPDAKWRVVIMHNAFFGASNQDQEDFPMRDWLAPEFSRLGIDVVLDGHQHCYCRSKMMNGCIPVDTYDYENIDEIVNPDVNEVLYVTFNSSSGSAYNRMKKTLGSFVAKAIQNLKPQMSDVEVDENSFTITTYEIDGEDVSVKDYFALKREGNDPVVKSVHVSTDSNTVKAGSTLTFTAQTLGLNNPSNDIIWSVSGNENEGTSIDANGVLTVAEAEFANSLTVTATSAADSAKYASKTVDVETISTTINVGQGITYKLPDTVNSLSVTKWTNYAGEEVTNVNTELVGCRYYIATLSDETQWVYRVNVGEYKTLMSDDLESYDSGTYESAFTDSLSGGKFTKGAYQANTVDKSQKLTKDGDNTVLSFGPYRSAFANARWTLDDKASEQAFKVSYKIKVASFNTNASTAATNTFLQLNFKDTAGVSFRTRMNTDTHTITKTEVLAASGVKDVSKDITSYVNWTAPQGDSVAMEDYITVDVEGNDVQYSVRVNGDEVINNVAWKGGQVPGASGYETQKGVNTIDLAKRTDQNNSNATVYVDDIVYSKAIYATDSLGRQGVVTAVTQGAASQQTATVTLNMSDGTTKDFTVNYTIDTSSLGVHDVTGTVDGFDDTVPVKVTVANVISSIEQNNSGISTAAIKQVGNVTSGVALFVYYGADDRMETVKVIPFNENDFTDGEAVVDVGLVFPVGVTGGYIKGFVLSDLTNIRPLDTVFLESRRN